MLARRTLVAIFQKTLVRASESRTFQIEHVADAGWQTRVVANGCVAHQQERREWHRVERDLARLMREIEGLRRQGWRDA
jgi:hypothetical protein